jgi:hypothetical protein
VISWYVNLECDILVSNFASKFNLYRYTAANRPLVLITLGMLFQPLLPRLQMRAASHFLTTKYALSLLAAAAATAAVPPTLAGVHSLPGGVTRLVA